MGIFFEILDNTEQSQVHGLLRSGRGEHVAGERIHVGPDGVVLFAREELVSPLFNSGVLALWRACFILWWH